MQQTPEEIQEIIEHNKKVSSYYTIWPILMFLLGLVIAALSFKHTIY